jgi:hypothetical protein
MINIQAQRTMIDGFLFDSNFESKIYNSLKKLCQQDEKLILNLQQPIVVKPCTLFFPRRLWLCDFQLIHSDWGYINIEAKGFTTRDFSITLEMLEINNPVDFHHLLVISDNTQVGAKYGLLVQYPEFISTLSDRKAWESFN